MRVPLTWENTDCLDLYPVSGRDTLKVKRSACVLVTRSACALIACALVVSCGDGEPDRPPDPTPVGDGPVPGGGGQDPGRLAEDLGIADPPDVAVVREITPSESQEVWSSCLADAGWVESGPHEGIEIPPGQEEAFNLAYYVCQRQYPVEERFTRPLTTEQLGILYDWWTEHTVPCYEERGWDVGDIPSREAFLANPVWLPAEQIAKQAQADVEQGLVADMDEAMYGVCPGPPDDLLYGG